VLSLDWDRWGRVTPASTRVPGSMAWSWVRGSKPWREPQQSAGRRARPGSRWVAQTAYTCLRRAPRPRRRLMATWVGVARHWLDAPLGAPLPLGLPGASLFLRVVVGRTRAQYVARAFPHFVIGGFDPAIHADTRMLDRAFWFAASRHGPPGQARWWRKKGNDPEGASHEGGNGDRSPKPP